MANEAVRVDAARSGAGLDLALRRTETVGGRRGHVKGAQPLRAISVGASWAGHAVAM